MSSSTPSGRPMPLPALFPTNSEVFLLATFLLRQLNHKESVLNAVCEDVNVLTGPFESPFDHILHHISDPYVRAKLKDLSQSVAATNHVLNGVAEAALDARIQLREFIYSYMSAVHALNGLDRRQAGKIIRVAHRPIDTGTHAPMMSDADAVYLESWADGVRGQFLEEDLSFVLAKAKNVVLRQENEPDSDNAIIGENEADKEAGPSALGKVTIGRKSSRSTRRSRTPVSDEDAAAARSQSTTVSSSAEEPNKPAASKAADGSEVKDHPTSSSHEETNARKEVPEASSVFEPSEGRDSPVQEQTEATGQLPGPSTKNESEVEAIISLRHAIERATKAKPSDPAYLASTPRVVRVQPAVSHESAEQAPPQTPRRSRSPTHTTRASLSKTIGKGKAPADRPGAADLTDLTESFQTAVMICEDKRVTGDTSERAHDDLARVLAAGRDTIRRRSGVHREWLSDFRSQQSRSQQTPARSRSRTPTEAGIEVVRLGDTSQGSISTRRRHPSTSVRFSSGALSMTSMDEQQVKTASTRDDTSYDVGDDSTPEQPRTALGPLAENARSSDQLQSTLESSAAPTRPLERKRRPALDNLHRILMSKHEPYDRAAITAASTGTVRSTFASERRDENGGIAPAAATPGHTPRPRGAPSRPTLGGQAGQGVSARRHLR